MRTRRALTFGLLFLLPPRLKPFVLRALCGAQVGRHTSIGWFSSLDASKVVLGDYARVAPLTVIKCDGQIAIGAYSQVSSFTLVYGSASFLMGDHSYVGPQSLINVEEDVRLGHHTALGARAMLYTHGSWFPYTEGYWVRFGSITIGNNVWCAAGVFLHPGVTIGDHVFINSRSVVTSDIGDNTVAEGNPARQVATMDQVRRRMTPARVDSALREMLGHFAEVELRRARGLDPARAANGDWLVTVRGRKRRVVVVSSDRADSPGSASPSEGSIFVVSRSGWADEFPAALPMIDVTVSLANTGGDELCEALVDFLKRYYGVQLEYTNTRR